MPTRSSRPNSGAVASPAQENKKRTLDESQESTLSPRRSKRTKPIAENPPSPVSASQTPRKPVRQVSANSKSRVVTAVDIKEEKLLEGDDLETLVSINKQKLSIAADKGIKEEVESEEEEIIVSKSTKKRKTKAVKEAEMLPLAARTKGLQMFVGAHVSAAKGWSIPFKYRFNALNIGQGYRIPS